MLVISSAGQQQRDLITQSPDGESRGMIFRIGDLFPLDPSGHLLEARAEHATCARPWGLRHLTPLSPRAGKHEGSSQATSSGTDGSGPEEVGKD